MASNRKKGKAILGRTWQRAGDFGHREIPDPPTNNRKSKETRRLGRDKERTIEGHSRQEIRPNKQMPDGSPINSEWNLGQEEKSC